MKQKFSYKQLIAFVNFANGYLVPETEENRLKTSVKSVIKQIVKDELIENYNEKVKDLRIENALVDEKTRALLKDDKGNYLYSIEGQKNFNKQSKELLSQEIDLYVRIHEDNDIVAQNFEMFERAALSGIVIPIVIDEDETPVV